MTAPQTFEQIAREYGPMIKRIAASYEANGHLAEELVQDIYFALWKALPAFRGASSLRTFVARIATNRASTHVTRAMKLPRAVELDEHVPSPAANPESQVIALDQQARLLTAVRALPLGYRQTVTLALEALTPTEIAALLGITANAVTVRLSRAKDILRQTLGDKP